jgi:processive 1,2-diacylglycerol beta-glucosyltransferase
MKVMIFTEMKVGEGHYQAAMAIEAVLRQKYGQKVDVKIYSGLRCIHPLIEWLTVGLYFFMIKYCPVIWKGLYTRTRKSNGLQTYFFSQRLLSLIKKEKPSIILCTHATCIPALSQLKEKGMYEFKLGAIFTDFDFHPFFVSQHVDYYFVADKVIKEKLNTYYKVGLDRIHVYGIPLLPEFEEDQTMKNNVIRFRNKKLFHILVLGGATGYGPIEKIIKFLKPYHSVCKLTVITGKNNKLYDKLTKNHSESVQVLGYVHNMRDWLSHVDLVISKPGGLTVSESIACGTPFIMIRPIPGHEEANRLFLEKQGLGIYVEEISDLPDQVLKIMGDPDLFKAWKNRIRNQQKKEAALNIVQTILS